MPEEMKFWDGSKRRNWFVMRAIAREVVKQPELLADARRWIEANWVDDPSKTRSLRLWRALAAMPAEDFAKALLADTPQAQEARENSPSWFALSGSALADAIIAARTELAIA